MDLRLTDLRAHFEAPLRTVRRAEECLLRCRGAHDGVSFDTAADGFRDQLTAVAENRKTIGVLLSQIVSDADKLRFAARSPRT